MIRFGIQFYKPFIQFIFGYDLTPKVLNEDKKLKPLPAGHRAYQMPDAVIQTIFDLKNINDNIYHFFWKRIT